MYAHLYANLNNRYKEPTILEYLTLFVIYTSVNNLKVSVTEKKEKVFF